MLTLPPRSWSHDRRWLIAAGVLVAFLIATGAAVSTDTSTTSLPVSLVLAHRTIRAGGSDTVLALNRSTHSLNTTGAAISPRTGTRFPTGSRALMWDDPYNSVAAHSTRRILQPPWSTYPPGKYWVWMAYAGSGDATRYAYTKLTVIAR